jgi:hypothetical protein
MYKRNKHRCLFLFLVSRDSSAQRLLLLLLGDCDLIGTMVRQLIQHISGQKLLLGTAAGRNSCSVVTISLEQ